MSPDEKERLRTAFNAVTAGMDAEAVKIIERRAGKDTVSALAEYEALARLSDTHCFALVIRGEESAFITLPRGCNENGELVAHLLDGAVIRI